MVKKIFLIINFCTHLNQLGFVLLIYFNYRYCSCQSMTSIAQPVSGLNVSLVHFGKKDVIDRVAFPI